MTRRVAVITSSRADWSHLRWPLRAMEAHPDLHVRLAAMAAQLSPEFGCAVREIEKDGFSVDARIECLLSSDSDVGMAKTIGVGILGLSDWLAAERPDVLLVIADRYEMLAPAAVALALRIPVAHVEGGEVSEGAIDDAVRNALTKMSHVHFVPTETARRRVLALGEEAWRVHRVGAPSLDQLRHAPPGDRAATEAALGLRFRDPALLVAIHPVTLAADTLEEADAFFAALRPLPHQLLFCFPNADAGGRALVERARALVADRPDARVFVNLAPPLYFALLGQVGALVGNSSSGIMETASFALPTVNVGRRQAGRERAANVLDAPAEARDITDAIERALDPAFRRGLAGIENPYGDGTASERMAAVLAALPPRDVLLRKRALPLDRHGGFGQG